MKYNIIYADPPWTYDVVLDKSRRLKYPMLSDQDLYDLDVGKIAADDCLLFIWGTWPKLPETLHTISAWGFTYKTVAFNWVKRNKKADSWFWGLGRWTRSNSEFCLLATKGKPKRMSGSVHSVIDERVEHHSKKPDVVRDKIVELCGDVPRIELFAREYTDGWDATGWDLNGEDIRDFLNNWSKK